MRLPRNVSEIRGESAGKAEYPHKELTEKIIGCAIKVHRELGAGYVENIYENSLVHELVMQKIPVERQKVFPVYYDGVQVGEHRAYLVVDSSVVVELKAVSELNNQHVAQLMSTMKAAVAKVGLLMNFNEARLVNGVRRIIL